MNEDYIPSLKYSKSHNTIIFSSILCFGNFRSEGFTFIFFSFIVTNYKKVYFSSLHALLCKKHTGVIGQVIIEQISFLNKSFQFISRVSLRVSDGQKEL